MEGGRSFQRKIDVEARELEREIEVYGNLRDTFHEMKVRLLLSKDELCLLDVEGWVVRGFTSKCRLAEEGLGSLKGLSLGAGFRNQLLERIGHEKGCTHLVSLILQINHSAPLFRGFHRDEVYQDFGFHWEERPPDVMIARYPQIKNICIAFAVNEADRQKD